MIMLSDSASIRAEWLLGFYPCDIDQAHCLVSPPNTVFELLQAAGLPLTTDLSDLTAVASRHLPRVVSWKAQRPWLQCSSRLGCLLLVSTHSYPQAPFCLPSDPLEDPSCNPVKPPSPRLAKSLTLSLPFPWAVSVGIAHNPLKLWCQCDK